MPWGFLGGSKAPPQGVPQKVMRRMMRIMRMMRMMMVERRHPEKGSHAVGEREGRH